jgi:two-component system phosphate regulon sensor histidine kinase PhoR
MTGALSRKLVLASIVLISLPLLALNLYAARDVALPVTAVTLIEAVVLTLVFSYRLRKRVELLNRFAECLPDTKSVGGISQVYGEDELGELARTLNRIPPKIKDLRERLSLELGRREAILASMAEGVLAVDKSLRVTFCNGSFMETVGAHGRTIEGVPLVNVVRDPVLLKMLQETVGSGAAVKRRVQLLSALTEVRSFEVQTAPLSTGGAIAVLHDITDLDRLERTRKDFVINVSHELRTPLAAIRGYAETLLDGALEDHEHRRTFVEIILANGIRLHNIASDLLILSEMEAGRQMAPPTRFSVRDAVEAALLTIGSEAKVSEVKLVSGTIDDVEIVGYKIRLEQVLLNLLNNAVKFNRPNGEVRVEAVRTSDAHVSISISDTGIGIPSQDLPRIFERFYRVDKARSREIGGTGLGLSIVKHAVEQMKGSIGVESQIGKGSRFTLLLPTCESEKLLGL